MSNFLELPAIKVEQPLGVFYSVCIKAIDLEQVTFVARAKYKKSGVFDKVLSPIVGTQRKFDEKREREIATYLESRESALPNSIILGANIYENGSLADDKEKWRVEEVSEGYYKLIIPTDKELASVIDGQHRLNGCIGSDVKDYNMVCSVYLDLPAPYHAYIFATINANQKKVDRSLAYELYGFDLESEDPSIWSPEKLSVYLVRKLNATDGPLYKKILLGAQIEDESDKGVVSLASFVDNILRLITSNPKMDRDKILSHKNDQGRRVLGVKKNSPPLRRYFVDNDDKYIERVVFDFILVVHERLMPLQSDRSYIKKTVGYQALFDFLRQYLVQNGGAYDRDEVSGLIERFLDVDFTDNFFTASGLGRGRMKNVILVKSGLKKLKSLSRSNDYENYQKILS